MPEARTQTDSISQQQLAELVALREDKRRATAAWDAAAGELRSQEGQPTEPGELAAELRDYRQPVNWKAALERFAERQGVDARALVARIENNNRRQGQRLWLGVV
jgi:hypothetical protein